MWGWLAGAFGTFFASSTAKWLATKVLVTAVVVTILPIILNNIMYDIMDEAMTLAGSHAGSQQSWIGTFTGMTAWIFQQLRLPEAFSLIISAVSVRYTLGLIPFVRA